MNHQDTPNSQVLYLQSLYTSLRQIKRHADVTLLMCSIITVMQNDILHLDTIKEMVNKLLENKFIVDSQIVNNALIQLNELGILERVEIRNTDSTKYSTKGPKSFYGIALKFKKFNLLITNLTSRYLQSQQLDEVVVKQISKQLDSVLLELVTQSYLSFKDLQILGEIPKMLCNPELMLSDQIFVCYTIFAISKGQNTVKKIVNYFPQGKFIFAKKTTVRLARVSKDLKSTNIITWCKVRTSLAGHELSYTVIADKKLAQILINIWLDFCKNQGVVSSNALNQLYPFTGLSKP